MSERNLHSVVQVSCTLLSIKGFELLIPNACIDEVFKPDLLSVEDISTWCHYSTLFRGKKVYLFHLENYLQDNPINAPFARIAVKLKKNTAFPRLPDLAIATSKMPKTIQASTFSLEKAYQPAKTHRLAMSYVTINDKPAFIPDIYRLFHEFSLQMAICTA